MNHANQFFFSVERLEALIHEYRSTKYPTSSGKEYKVLKGFVFIPGNDEQGNAAMFGFPLFSEKLPGGDGDVLEQNTAASKAGCPYPPPCNKFDIKKDCYSK